MSTKHHITLTCPTCGGKLQITESIERFACAYCGNEHIVERGVGTITLQPVVDELSEVKIGVDKTSSELAISRLIKEIESLKYEKEVARGQWLGSTYSQGLFPIVMLAMATFACFLTQSPRYIPILMVIVTAVSGGVTLYYLNQKKLKQEQKWQAYDNAIAQKTQELRHHQNIVSGF